MRLVVLLLVFGLIAPESAVCKIPRSAEARREFVRMHPCPATGKRYGACKGWVVDHVMPLACGGADSPKNMQWQTIEEGKAKDRWERNCKGHP